ncbi:MAG: hypothetical protein KDH15_05585 [Rhodocyclaceae bacterium]|nr:hypothetical protein [Rhodocyclaceae bacterium]
MARVSGRGLLFSLLVMLLGPVPAALGDEPATVGPVDRLLLREQSIGAGYFVVSAEGAGGFSGFMNPTSLAAEGSTLFVADQGLRRVYRVELDSREVTPLATLGGAAPRLRIGLARSWFLLPPAGNVVREFGPEGEPRGEYSNVELTQATDVLREPSSGRIWIFDFAGTMHEFSPGGSLLRSRRILADHGTAIQAAAAGSQFIYALDRHCACVIELDHHGLPLRMIADGELAFASDLAVDGYGRIWLSQHDRTQIVMIDNTERVHHLELHDLGLNLVSALTIADGRLFVADPTTGAVVVFSLLPPDPGAQ